MGRKIWAVAAVVALASAASVTTAAAQTTGTVPATPSTAPTGPPPKAFIVVDQATGVVVASSNDRQPLPPASLTKILTALVAVAALPADSGVPVSVRAAGMPAHKLSMQAGSTWKIDDVLHALLVSSANDAAAALAERVSGSLENFDTSLDALARHLQLGDAPTLQDAAGLDDNWSIGGGNLISARDLAIATRALLAEPRLAPIVAEPISRFTDPAGIPHRLVNHNKLLTRYAGAVGVKTGYTKKAGRGLVAAATRDGRTEIAVVLDVGDTYGWAASLLDAAFATAVPTSGDRLPAIPPGLRLKAAALPAAAVAPAADAGSNNASVTSDEPKTNAIDASPVANRNVVQRLPLAATIALLIVAGLSLAVVVLRARVLIRRRYRRRRRHTASVRHHVNRRRHPRLTPHYQPHDELSDRFHAAGRD